MFPLFNFILSVLIFLFVFRRPGDGDGAAGPEIKSCGQPSRDPPGSRPDGSDGGVHPSTNVPTGQPVKSTAVAADPTVVSSHTDGAEAAALDDTINIAPPIPPVAPASTASPWMKEAALAPRKLQFDVENEVNSSHVSAARALSTPAAKHRKDPWNELDEIFVSNDQLSVSDDTQEFEDAEESDSKDKMDDDLVSRLLCVSGDSTWSLSLFLMGHIQAKRVSLFLLFGFIFRENQIFDSFSGFKL